MDSLLMDLADHYLTFFLHAIALAQAKEEVTAKGMGGDAHPPPIPFCGQLPTEMKCTLMVSSPRG
jgi:hypothetical protein